MIKALEGITRKTLLYKSKVEYSDWTINHIQGCAHGCKFPCYAFMMAKRFGRVNSYEEWIQPKIVMNALDILDKELKSYKNKIDSVHLCFTTDPFMFDFKEQKPNEEVKELSLKIIEKLNKSGIPITSLTKGVYPEEIINSDFHKDNSYGITIVSLNDDFREDFEPFSAPYTKRIDALRKLHSAGLKTWVSIEPYPTPNIDKTSADIMPLLKELGFVDRIIFGRLNYNVSSGQFENNKEFYNEKAQQVIDFCNTNKIEYHIKEKTITS